MTEMGLPNGAGIFEVRFNVRIGSLPTILQDEAGGVLLLATCADQAEHAPVVLVVDMEALGHPNPGASATNAMEEVVGFWADPIAAALSRTPRDLVWVQLDSLGGFDVVIPKVTEHGAAASVDWRPLRSLSGRQAHRAEAAFLELFPLVGARLLQRLRQHGWSTNRPSEG